MSPNGSAMSPDGLADEPQSAPLELPGLLCDWPPDCNRRLGRRCATRCRSWWAALTSSSTTHARRSAGHPSTTCRCFRPNGAWLTTRWSSCAAGRPATPRSAHCSAAAVSQQRTAVVDGQRTARRRAQLTWRMVRRGRVGPARQLRWAEAPLQPPRSRARTRAWTRAPSAASPPPRRCSQAVADRPPSYPGCRCPWRRRSGRALCSPSSLSCRATRCATTPPSPGGARTATPTWASSLTCAPRTAGCYALKRSPLPKWRRCSQSTPSRPPSSTGGSARSWRRQVRRPGRWRAGRRATRARAAIATREATAASVVTAATPTVRPLRTRSSLLSTSRRWKGASTR